MVIREVEILRKLSSIPGNKHTVKLIDCIAPESFSDQPGSNYLFVVTERVKYDLC